MKEKICYAMIGSGRASELHLDALKKYGNKPLYLKYIFSNDLESAKKYQEKYGFEHITNNFNAIINDEDVDVIDICTPPFLHLEMAKQALLKDKNVICEKPLTGVFDSSKSKNEMLKNLVNELDEFEKIVNKSNGKFMYAENFIYAPSIQKSNEILKNKKSKILFAKGEESLKGSSSSVAGQWDKTGGGSLIRTGIHPLTAILYLKKKEALYRNETFAVKSVNAEVGRISSTLDKEEHKYISSNPIDVEDNGVITLTFNDGSKAVIIASDTFLGGSKNYVELYCNNTSIKCNLTMNDNMQTYFLDNNNLNDINLSEMASTNVGWNCAFVADEILRGYVDEMNDFINSIINNKEPESNFEIAKLAIKVIYSAYYSAEIGSKIDF